MSNIEDLYKSHFDYFKIGFLLQCHFLEYSIADDISAFIDFIKENEQFTDFDIKYYTECLDFMISFFYSFIDSFLNRVDPDLNYLNYLKDFT